MNQNITELLTLLGAFVCETVAENTTYLIVGESLGIKKLPTALIFRTKIITEDRFAKMLGECEVKEE